MFLFIFFDTYSFSYDIVQVRRKTLKAKSAVETVHLPDLWVVASWVIFPWAKQARTSSSRSSVKGINTNLPSSQQICPLPIGEKYLIAPLWPQRLLTVSSTTRKFLSWRDQVIERGWNPAEHLQTRAPPAAPFIVNPHGSLINPLRTTASNWYSGAL